MNKIKSSKTITKLVDDVEIKTIEIPIVRQVQDEYLNIRIHKDDLALLIRAAGQYKTAWAEDLVERLKKDFDIEAYAGYYWSRSTYANGSELQ